ncbi:class I SAM-dependent RNA methyltransferase [Porphyrobacter sp. ULC335]|uniref:class I SAM-dependent RNA methyltransferase n=1 Tax=Porphyrobacter sp. ULC335 TaxID=2854260 RepID=UPI00221E4D9A|nr:class I SAM-dependent RNA methyltransferase [Porphyrobacter sp. ULC335]UYV14922.1 class I SAM-dependent RNA methyltransferase [Porphyrobacter sp. ULC335]
MTLPEPIIRLAAKGDGVTASGRHIAGAVPRDMVDESGAITPGPHHIAPACRHFNTCGGCLLQHVDDAALTDFVRDRVVHAARGQGLEPGELLPVHLSPPHARRRAGLHGLRTAKGAVLGYREGGSHRVVDLAECPVLHPRLAALIPPLRRFVAAHGPKAMVGIDLTLADQGVEASISQFPLEGLGPTEAALDFARDQALARLSFDQGYGPETVWEPEPVTVTLAGVPVGLPPGAFLQATADAENRMVADAAEWFVGARIVVDLFAGLGTFAFGLRDGRKVLAVEAERAAHLACKAAGPRAGGTVLALHRDLFRSPLQPDELNRFDAVLLDPPRAGARAQVAEIAASTVSRVVYVSCNPSSWARDAAVLAGAGFKLSKLRPVGQFRWSTHVELVSLFER